MHQLSGFSKKIMTSQIKQHCWKGMCVGGKGVTRGRQRLSLETADNEMVGLPSVGFRLLCLLSVFLYLLVPAKYMQELNRVLLTLHLVLKEGPLTLLTPVIIT